MPDISLPIIISASTLIFLVELPDKTALATMALATKYKAHSVLLGVSLAFLIQTVVGVLFGRVLLFLPAQPVHIVAGLGFLVFAFFTLHHDEAKEMEYEKELIEKEASLHHKAWTTSFLVLFLSEWGDLSQLATAAFVARTNQPISVGIGAMIALMAVALLAVAAGAKLSTLLKPSKLKKISAGLFFLVGIIILALTFFPIPGIPF